MQTPFTVAALSAIPVLISLHSPPPALVIRNVRLFDGQQTLDRTTVLVQDGTIRAVGRDTAAPPGATIIDGQDRTLLPGLIDSHVHVADDAVSALEQAAVLGVTTVLDMFSAGERLRMLKRVAAMDAEGMADLRTAGTGAAAAGGHPTQMGEPPFPTIADADEAPAFVDARLAEGADSVICGSEARTLLADAFLRPYLRAQWRRMVEMPRPARACDGAKAALEQLMDSRAAVLAGTDAPSPGTTYGASLPGGRSVAILLVEDPTRFVERHRHDEGSAHPLVSLDSQRTADEADVRHPDDHSTGTGLDDA